MNHELLQAAQGLGAGQRQAVYALATRPPPHVLRDLTRGLAVVAALLLGLGLIFWIAANWQLHTRWFKLGVVQGALAVAVLLAVALPRARTAALLAATLALGGLLALIGQTYQTGADTWQLFAMWALLALPWTLLQRSQVLWLVWVGIASVALWLWTGRGGFRMGWGAAPPLADFVIHLLAWVPLVLLPAGVGRLGWVGGGNRWAVRLALAAALAHWASQGLEAAFDWGSGGWTLRLLVGALALGLMAVAAACAWHWRDLPSLALAGLGLNVVALGWVGKWAWQWAGDTVGMSLTSLLALLALGGMATGLLRLQRSWHPKGDAGHIPTQEAA